MIIRLALRNLVAHKLRTGVVGGLLVVSTVVLLLGASVVDAVFAGMRSATVNSMAGDIQVYDSEAKDELAVFGQPGGLKPEIGRIPNFGVVRDALLKVPNVRAVVPLGTGNSIIFGTNTLEVKLAALRQAVMDKQPEKWPPLKKHIQKMVQVLREDLKNLDGIVDAASVDQEGLKLADEAKTDAWWAEFDKQPLERLELLDNKIAPLATQGRFIFFRYVGTDPQAFGKSFKLFKMLTGTMVPKGRRGVILNKRRYERDMKNRIANKLDEIKEARDNDERIIAEDEELQTWIDRNSKQSRSLIYDMTPDQAASLTTELGTFLKMEAESDLETLMKAFLAMDDSNFDARYAWFYEQIAPKIVLYRYKVGDYITVTARGRTGFTKALNLKIYGTFTFDSLEKSQLAGGFHVIDMMSFRDLDGTPTKSERKEMGKIADEMGVKDLDEEDAVDALFGEDSDVTEEAVAPTPGENGVVAGQQGPGFDEFAEATIAGRRQEAAAAQDKPYTQEELDSGMAKHAAVLLEDDTQLESTMATIAAMSDKEGLRIQALPWDEASGIIGGFTQAIQLALWFVIIIVFVVVLIIVNNSIVMATMDRVQEIGTMRAIGGQRSLIIKLFLGESMVLGAIAAAVGLVLGVSLISYLNSVGIAAGDPILYFLFGGPNLHPTLSVGNVIVTLSTVLGVTFIATLYPAWVAAATEPIVAMNGKD